MGLDHYARPCDELARAASEGGLHRNFQGYSTRAVPRFTPLASPPFPPPPTATGKTTRISSPTAKALAARRLPVERGWRLTPEDHRRRAIVMAIMCDRRLDYAAISREIGVDFARTYASELASLTDLEGDGVVEVNGDGLRVTEAGLPLLRVIAQRFDGYRRTGTHAQPV